MVFPYSAERAAMKGEHPWKGDSPEQYEKEIPNPTDVVTALMVVGYETLYNTPTPPSEVFADFASDLQAYVVERSSKMSNEAMQGFLHANGELPHIQQFLTEAFEVVEFAHLKGLPTRALSAQIQAQAARFVQLQQEFSGQYPQVSESERAIRVWQEALTQTQATESDWAAA